MSVARADLLQAHGLTRGYMMRRGLLGRPSLVRAVDGVSLTVARGETLGLVGESGCGKSTTARLVLGIEPPDTGTVTFDGGPMPMTGTTAWAALRRRMQMVYQDPLAALDRRLAIGTQIAEPLDIHRIGNPVERRERVAAVMAEVGLQPHHAARHPQSLSGGQRQRAVIARALVTNPDLLVCDEPISALDVSIQALVLNLLTDLQERLQMGMLFVSHDLRAVRQISHRVAVMYLGRIVEEGEPDAVLHEPAHPYTQALVSAIPHPGKTATRVILQGDPPNPANRPTGCAFHPRCPVATATCRTETPDLKPRASDGRRVACHVAHGEASSARAPASLETC
ncbi:peptide/nickel transport system ATP-binding protein [Rhizobium sp. RU35A]|uniref:ATP-binding cassette domain-containing protein n=1 Tax=Rhizobium straminoryzae TaxID=1387186 RepID=A0A549T8H0_9HYPH|nr:MULTISPECIES: oligopeptide/dipeptide ABC transporter ATP-binding protein [Rhizobium]TRL38163.1 ATP-binding cassette domain-containing protein [Rhizobium straminoryzae]SIQ31048.1 peptide/nickel transport system ATP-binding protein [Rhizobium sp. RU35A]